MYSPNRTTGQWRAHGRYIARDSAMQGRDARAFGDQGEVVAPPEVLDRWQKAGDPRLWKMIISPEFGERIDLNRLTRDLMSKMEKDLDTRLEWVAVPHSNTEHPHVHVAMRGIKADGSPLDLKREYIRNGIRSIAEDLCTGQIGHRNQVDAMTAERREINECRYTSLDRMINRANAAGQVDGSDDAGHFVVRRNINGVARGEFAKIREQHIAARLIVLQKMGLAEQAASGEWRVRRDFEGVLRAMQRSGDRQKMLAAHGALLSDERLQLVVSDQRTLTSLEGRVLYMEKARSTEALAATTSSSKAPTPGCISCITRLLWRKRVAEDNSAQIRSSGSGSSSRTAERFLRLMTWVMLRRSYGTGGIS